MSRDAPMSQVRDRKRTVPLVGILPALVVVLTLLLCNPVRTLTSLRQADDHPLYVMHYYGPYSSQLLLETGVEQTIYGVVRGMTMPDACTCFAGLSPDGDKVFGRNFDWHDHPALLQEYNVTFYDPPIHYLISDSSGRSAIVEYVDGEMKVLVNDEPWQVATNFIVSEVLPIEADAPCQRYNRAYEALSAAHGSISQNEAMAILDNVAGGNTIWSAVYDMTSGEIQVVMDKEYDQVHTFQLEMEETTSK